MNSLVQTVPIVLQRRWMSQGCKGLSTSSIRQLQTTALKRGLSLRVLEEYCAALRCPVWEVVREAELATPSHHAETR